MDTPDTLTAAEADATVDALTFELADGFNGVAVGADPRIVLSPGRPYTTDDPAVIARLDHRRGVQRSAQTKPRAKSKAGGDAS